MSIVTLLLLVLALGICLVPVWLLRRSEHKRARDYLVASQYTRPEVVRNASIAYALRMAAFGPLFAWGASGELWPALIASACFGLGVYLIYLLRRSLLEFVDSALEADRSITIHEFIAKQHGNDPRVRVFAASITLCALLGLLAGEALGIAALFKPMLDGNAAVVFLLASGALLFILLCFGMSGHSGIMHSMQVQLGMLYLSLFGSTLLWLYLHVSARTPLPPHGTLGVALIALCSAIVLGYRRSKYVDTDPIRNSGSRTTGERPPQLARGLSRFGKILNICVSVLLILLIGLALVDLNAAGWRNATLDCVAALRTGTRLPGIALFAVALLPLLYPLVDVTNWLRLAAVPKEPGSRTTPGRRSVLRAVFATYAVESALLWLFMGGLGTIAALALRTPREALHAFLGEFFAADNAVAATALSLLLIGFFLAALSTMAALFSAGLCTLRYDMLPLMWPKLAPERTLESTEADARQRTLVAGSALGLVFVAAFCFADAVLPLHIASGTFPAVLLALACTQLSLAPLVLGPIVGRARGGAGIVTPAWALFVLALGAASAIVPVTVYAATGSEPWLWSACPACLGSAVLVFAIGCASHRASAQRLPVRGVPKAAGLDEEPERDG